MSCAEFLQDCDGNCTDNSAFKDACDTCPPNKCSDYLETCVGNCTDNTVFKDACISECGVQPGQILLWVLLVGAVIYYFCVYRPKKKRKKAQRTAVSIEQVTAVPIVQAIAVPLQSGSVYPADRLTEQDSINRTLSFEKTNGPIRPNFKTHDGYIVDSVLNTIIYTPNVPRALNQASLF